METLKERIEVCKATAAEIIAAYPGVQNIEFTLEDCDIDEIKQFDPNPRINNGRLRGLVNTYTGNCCIWANTKPFKSIKPLEYEF